ncbi:MAG: hypothetical protein ACREQ9_25380 [Candidatus Binatia bacterium]
MMRSIAAAVLSVVAGMSMLGCGDDPPGPGGSTIAGNVSNAETAEAASARGSWLAWLATEVVGLVRVAHAQGSDTSLDGILVIARSGGRETSGITASSGDFFLSSAPTGDVTILFRRGGCEASVPIGSVASNSTITLSDVSFVCTGNSGNASIDEISEIFAGVARDDVDAGSVRVCVRVGSDDRTRTVSTQGAIVQDESGDTTTDAAIREDDLLEIEGNRSDAGNSFTLDTERIRILDRDVRDVCDDDPFT